MRFIVETGDLPIPAGARQLELRIAELPGPAAPILARFGDIRDDGAQIDAEPLLEHLLRRAR